MRERMRLCMAACFYYSGLVHLAHWWIRRCGGRRLMILKYHRARGDLQHQIRYLRRHYRIMPLEAALEELYAPREERRAVRDRRIPLVVTFDDGYRDNYTCAFVLARQLHVPITIFLPPGYVESGACFWWIESEQLVRYAQADKVTIEGHTYHLEQPGERKVLSRAITAHVTYARSVAERETFLTEMRKALAVPEDSPVEEAALPLTWGEVQKMEESGLVTFGAHTVHHPVLACLHDSVELRWEVEESRKLLEERLHHPVSTFAYPIGSPKNIGDEGVRAVKAAGYKWAFTTVEEVNTPQTDPYLLNRLNGNEHTHWLVMASELVGLLPIVSRLKKKLCKAFSRI